MAAIPWYVAKSVYCVDNVVQDVSESDMESFLASHQYFCHNLSCRETAAIRMAETSKNHTWG